MMPCSAGLAFVCPPNAVFSPLALLLRTIHLNRPDRSRSPHGLTIRATSASSTTLVLQAPAQSLRSLSEPR
jgi:hypothetical protein